MIIKRLSAVFRLSDSAAGRIFSRNQVQITVDGQLSAPVFKPGGYFVLTDLAEGTHHIAIRSFQFQPAEFDITVDYSRRFDEKQDVRAVMLNPDVNHPSARTNVSIEGCFEGKKATSFCIAGCGAQLKIAEDGVEAGRRQLKLFTASTVMLPSLFHINDKNEKYSEFVLVNQAAGDLYTLDMPLKFPHKRSTALVPMVKYRSADDGSFFAVLPSGYKPDSDGKLTVTMLIETDNGLTAKTFSLESGGRHALGTISVS